MSNSNLQKRTPLERPGQLAWDDLRTVLAIARSGSLSGAARALEVEHSTVFRRLEEIERRLGTSLFERSRSGYLANAHGEAVAEAARTMEEAALAAERRVLGADSRLTGVVRIATSEMLGTYLLPRLLEDFLAAHPEIEVEVEISNRAVDLNRREADLALRATMVPPEHLIARKVGEVASAIYATQALAERIGADAPLHALPWIGFESGMANVLQAKWMRETIPDAVPRLRMNSFPAIIQAAALGVGVAALPQFAAAQEPRLMRISDTLTPRMNCWLLTHPDVRDNARVRALLLHIAERTPSLLEALACEGPMCQRTVCATATSIKPRKRRATTQARKEAAETATSAVSPSPNPSTAGGEGLRSRGRPVMKGRGTKKTSRE